QLVASGFLLRFRSDIDYSVSVAVIGGLMTIYVIFGGIIAASWVQIVKTIVLMSGTFLLSLIVLSRFHWDVGGIITRVEESSPLGESFFYPGHLFDHPVELLSLQLSLLLGTAGLPHILIRLFTVKNTLEVRRSLLSSTWIIGVFYVLNYYLCLGELVIL